MELIKFDAKRCSLCGKCVEKCPFGALSFEDNGIVVGDTCRMCGMCVRQCPEKAISFEQKAGSFDKDKWKDFLIFVEQERGDIHPVAFELIGEARKMASKVNFKVKCVIAGGAGTIENAHKLLDYGVDQVFAYEDESLEGFRADCYTDVVAECIAAQKPSSVLIGATALGRSLAPRLATRFHTGLTADCTTLDIKSNTDMVWWKYHGSDFYHKIKTTVCNCKIQSYGCGTEGRQCQRRSRCLSSQRRDETISN